MLKWYLFIHFIFFIIGEEGVKFLSCLQGPNFKALLENPFEYTHGNKSRQFRSSIQGPRFLRYAKPAKVAKNYISLHSTSAKPVNLLESDVRDIH
jgi:hypothetical protein